MACVEEIHQLENLRRDYNSVFVIDSVHSVSYVSSMICVEEIHQLEGIRLDYNSVFVIDSVLNISYVSSLACVDKGDAPIGAYQAVL